MFKKYYHLFHFAGASTTLESIFIPESQLGLYVEFADDAVFITDQAYQS